MTKQELTDGICRFLETSEGNRVVVDGRALSLFRTPLVGVAAAGDALFATYRQPEVIGPHFRTPEQWLSGAKSVVSFFVPFTADVRDSNRRENRRPSQEWLYGRIEGQQMVVALCEYILSTLRGAGYRAVSPSLTSEFWTVSEPPSEEGLTFTSNWSERHVAYACGLGTFGLSKGLITKEGIAGRYGSVVTDLELEPTAREYSGVYDYCTNCGACVSRCPAGAITLEQGKNHHLCFEYQKSILHKCLPRYGCGLCQTGVPCERRKPLK